MMSALILTTLRVWEDSLEVISTGLILIPMKYSRCSLQVQVGVCLEVLGALVAWMTLTSFHSLLEQELVVQDNRELAMLEVLADSQASQWDLWVAKEVEIKTKSSPSVLVVNEVANPCFI
jgi:uncharacterized YccA/Bax inhibitor family protein